MASNYDNSAWFYDSLAGLFYGSALTDAQVYLLQFIKPGSTILIAGGGTGWILEELARIHPSGLRITYVEISAKMMALSAKRSVGNNNISYINKPVEEADLAPGFDVIITPFLFDNFREETLKTVFNRLHGLIKPSGLWLNTDFQLTGKWWQNVLLKTMFVFFKIVCGIETSVLPDIEKQFSQCGYDTIAEKNFYGDFISSKAHKKS
ncbi:bifunctional 2-polyprenyl-6-hydroxyphenol methylase/3-demethylubiquinol 3-O-methyltransferase UbiG [Mucilaginibacter sp. UR6-11]|uniref:class I SAM-dependent methyltransferase n=1 Tax=Mucilaginibacter sp. UR6-11 TaxID=1435644 RepID=UPI001E5DA5A0|nr:class I SAM-dependent methyltransferase [Mucilaginibacter sp. UR6-11]MCC8425158.1 class I SAM-dependent methyltransferase [Mucilaginibacter sp. UR6-11]